MNQNNELFFLGTIFSNESPGSDTGDVIIILKLKEKWSICLYTWRSSYLKRKLH